MPQERLTLTAADQRAKAQWGPTAGIQWNAREGWKHVGVVRLGCLFQVFGTGKTWESAFADAQRKRRKRP